MQRGTEPGNLQGIQDEEGHVVGEAAVACRVRAGGDRSNDAAVQVATGGRDGGPCRRRGSGRALLATPHGPGSVARATDGVDQHDLRADGNVELRRGKPAALETVRVVAVAVSGAARVVLAETGVTAAPARALLRRRCPAGRAAPSRSSCWPRLHPAVTSRTSEPIET